MWIKALGPIKVLGADSKTARTVGEGDPPFEIDDDAGDELVALGAGAELSADEAATAVAAAAAAAKAKAAAKTKK